MVLDPATELDVVRALERDEETQVAVLIYPRLELGPDAFDRHVSALRERAGAACPFAMAMFHPEAPYGTDTPQRLVMFLRRSPDPTIQLVRFSALDAVRTASPGGKFLFDFSAAGWATLHKRGDAPGISERIARDNYELVMREGVARLQAIYDDIRADRARSYARFSTG